MKISGSLASPEMEIVPGIVTKWISKNKDVAQLTGTLQ